MAEDTTTAVPIVDIGAFLSGDGSPDEVAALCAAVAEAFSTYGAIVVKDPRVSQEVNNAFIDQMEEYYAQPMSAKEPDIRPDLHYQVGATPEGTEVAKCASDPSCIAKLEALPDDAKAHIPTGPDPKWRFFWNANDNVPEETEFPVLTAGPVIPAAFPDWAETMDAWGSLMLGAIYTVAEMLAIGLDLEADAFTSRMDMGPHLLAPTGCDLDAHGTLDQIIAGYHNDISFMTIHGKSRFPGLFIWLRDGRRCSVKVPDGHLLIQAGQQVEYLTAGTVMAGYHEVVVSEATLAAAEAAREAGRSLWRVSSTLFSHVSNDLLLEPLSQDLIARGGAAPDAYPPIKAGAHVQRELEHINLKPEAEAAA